MDNYVKNIISIATAVIEGIFFTGIIFGWPSLSYVLKEEGYFGDSTRAIQDQNLILVAIVSFALMSIAVLPSGYILDKCGTWVTRTIAVVMYATASLMVINSSPEVSWILYPAMICFAASGQIFLMTNVQVGNFFSPIRATIINFLSGAFDTSAFVFLIMKFAYDYGFSLKTIFIITLLCSIFPLIRTFLLLPKSYVPYPLPKDFTYGIKNCFPSNKNTNIVQQSSSYESIDQRTLTSCVCSMEFWLTVAQNTILSFRYCFFTCTFNVWMQPLVSNEDEYSTYVNWYGTIQLFGILLCPLNGLITDAFLKKFLNNYSNTVAERKAVSMSLLATSTLGIIFSILVCIPNAPIQYASFVLLCAFRGFVYGSWSSSISILFPMEHFGKLFGISRLLFGVIELLQIPISHYILNNWNGDFLTVNICLVFVTAMTIINPILLFRRAENVSMSRKCSHSEFIKV